MGNAARSKQEKLIISSAVAPALRQASTARVKVYPREEEERLARGEITRLADLTVKRVTTRGVIQEAAAHAHGLEVEVLHPEEWCSAYPKCRRRAPRYALNPSQRERRGGRPWTCKEHCKKVIIGCAECGTPVGHNAAAKAHRSGRRVFCRAHRQVAIKEALSFRKKEPVRCAECGTLVSASSASKARRGVAVFCSEHRTLAMRLALGLSATPQAQPVAPKRGPSSAAGIRTRRGKR